MSLFFIGWHMVRSVTFEKMSMVEMLGGEEEVLDIFLNSPKDFDGFSTFKNLTDTNNEEEDFYKRYDSSSPPQSWSSNNTVSSGENDLLQDQFLESIRYGTKIEEEPKFFEEDNLAILDNFEVMDVNNELKVVQLIQFKPVQKVLDMDDDLSEEDSVSSVLDNPYQELKLSDEENRLLSKEGICLPSHYPLTKFEERELKRIRRKIRNKISAQDSRKRKKEYLDKLQQRVLEIEEEKSVLSKKVRTLEVSNVKLSCQVKRLQQALAQHQHTQNNNNKSCGVPAATTLLVLILSLALVVLPTNKHSNLQHSVTQQHQLIDNQIFNHNSSSGGVSSGGVSSGGVSSGGVSSGGVVDRIGKSRTMVDTTRDFFEPVIKMPRFSFQHSNYKEFLDDI